MDLSKLRTELCRFGKRIPSQGLATGAGGNISASDGRTMLISPSGCALEEIEAPEWVAVDIETGVITQDSAKPSSEVLMHLACYRRRPDIRAVIHTHPQFTIALTSSGHDLRPMFADAIIYLGKHVPHLDYVTVTTPELAEAVQTHISDANCIILRNHGCITVGDNLKQAFWRTCTAEEAARIQLFATLVGTPRFLDESEADRLEGLASEKYRRELLARMSV